MKKQRTLHELYKILLKCNLSWGICSAIGDLEEEGIITLEEGSILFDDFQSQRIMAIDKFKASATKIWWWSITNIEVREKFIKHLIKLHTPK